MLPPQSCYSFDLAAGAPLIVHSSCRRHCRRRHAKLLCLGGYESAAARRWWRLHSGAVVFALAIARAHKPGTGAQWRHWCKAPQRHHCAATAAAPHYFALEAAPPAPAWRGAAAARTATIEQSSSTLYSFAMGTRTASNYDYYILCILSQELRHQQILGTAHCSLALLCSTLAFFVYYQS